MKKARASGFTLIEMMITVVILGILAGIAYPSYVKYSTQTRRSDAKIALTQVANLQERYFTNCNYYAQVLTGTWACGTVGTATSILGYSNNLSPEGYYQLSIAAGNLSGPCTAGGSMGALYTCGYTITATPPAGSRQYGDGGFRIDSLGTKQWDKLNNGFTSGVVGWNDK